MTQEQALAFMKEVDENAPFWVELHDEDRPTISVNGNDVPQCLYNLMLAKRDIRIFVDLDTEPNRHWNISDVKKYFGLNGSKQKIKDALLLMHDEFIGRIINDENG
jgi:hypothetical protein